MIRRIAFLLLLAPGLAWGQSVQYGPPGLTPFVNNGGTSALSSADRFAEAVDILGFGVGGAAVDRTGVTDASGAIQAAVTAACGFLPIKAVHIPFGTYAIATRVLIPGGCNGLVIYGDQGTTLKITAGNASNPAIFQAKTAADHSLLSNLTIASLTLDGNASASTNSNGLISLTWPTDRFACIDCRLQNSIGSAIGLVGEQPLSGNLSAQASSGQAVLAFTSTPSGVVAGSVPVITSCLDPDMYVLSVTGTTATLNRNLSDTCLSGTKISFTAGFTSNADAVYGASTIATSSTTNLSVGETIYAPGSTGQGTCLATNTRITAIVANTSVAIDKLLNCKVVSGTSFAASGGHSNPLIERAIISEIGQSLITGSTATFTANGSNPAGSTLVLNCNTASCDEGNVYPGQTTGSSPPAGVPANTLITDSSVNTGASTTTITLASPLTGAVTNGTSIGFKTALGGNGYGVWYSWGAPFSQNGGMFRGNLITHTWVAPLYLAGSGNAALIGNTYIEDMREYRDYSVAPSPCVNAQNTVGLSITGDNCSGATGAGVEAQHPAKLTVANSKYIGNGVAGISVFGGHDVVLDGIVTQNNGQYVNMPWTRNEASRETIDGINISGAQTFANAGNATNFRLANIDASDTQATPTQTYGIGKFNPANTTSTFTNLVMQSIGGSGNTSGLTNFAPVASSCGTSPTVSSNSSDTAGSVTLGSTATGCTITFISAKSVAPACTISPGSAAAAAALLTAAISATAITLTTFSNSGSVYGYVCQ